MTDMEVLARSQEEALKKAAEELEVTPQDLEIIEEYEPDEADLKQHQELEGLPEPVSPDELSLYVVRINHEWYRRAAEEWTNGLIAHFAPGSSAKAVRFRNLIVIRLTVPETSILIGKKGATLDALQHVVIRALLTMDEKFPDVMLDVEGYREKKLARLEREARRAADKAIRIGRRVPLAPMSPAERKFVHKMLMDMGGVRTESKGQDDKRHIVVEPIDARPQRDDRPRSGNRSGNSSGPGGSNQGGPPRKGVRPPVTDDQRQLLYGGLPPDDDDFEDEEDDSLETRQSLMPEYIPTDDDEDGDDEDGKPHLADELE